MGKLAEKMAKAAREAAGKGSAATRSARTSHYRDLEKHLRSENIQVRSPEHVSPKHVAGYVAALKERGVSSGSVQNRLASIRAAWRGSGCAKWASKTNKELGAEARSRTGTKTAMSDEKYAQARADLAAKGQEREAAALALQRHLGLRAEETVRASDSLRTWEKALAAGQPIRVLAGTKGGRPRWVSPGDTQRALDAVREAKKAAQGGHLIRGESGTLKSAMDKLDNSYRSVGLQGEQSGHSARYAFARDQLRHYESQGHTQAEARAMTSLDLGHGDGRGRYVASVYAR